MPTSGELPLALRIQRFDSSLDRVLAVAGLAAAAGENGWFSPSQVERLFEGLRLPVPNSRAGLSRLRERGRTTRRPTAPNWSLTPEGRLAARDLLGNVDPQFEMRLNALQGAEFGHAGHGLIPPELAPAKWAAPIRGLLDQFPFERNILLMTRFPTDDDASLPDPIAATIDVLRAVATLHGLRLHLASDRQLDDDLLGNVAAHMWACRYGIGLVENRADRGLNYNVILEIGAMLMTGRRCALLKDVSAPDMPSDIAGQIYKPVDYNDTDAVAATAHLWIRDDLQVGQCSGCPTYSRSTR